MMSVSSLTLIALTLYVCSVAVHGQCEQGTNCELPSCYCAGAGVPSGMNVKKVPQMVVLALDGNLDNHRDAHYEQLLTKNLRNPNGCDISATMFVPGQSTDFSLVKKWFDRGIEMALNSQLGSPTYNYWFNIKRPEMKNEVLEPLGKFLKDGEIPRTDIYGYRNPAFFAAGNAHYQVLEYEGFEYDATLRFSRKSIFETNIWPSTLDFQWTHRCVVGKCPDNTYPGLWVVPSVTLFNGTEAGLHSANVYAYATAFQAKSKEKMFDFLWNNFNGFYEIGRGPFILNMNTVGFLGDHGEERLQGFQQFMTKALEKPDVFFVSMHQMIQWMRDPTPLDKIDAFLPWSCKESSQKLKKAERKGTPINLDNLQRKSKSRVLFSSSSCSNVYGSLLVFTLPLLHSLIQR